MYLRRPLQIRQFFRLGPRNQRGPEHDTVRRVNDQIHPHNEMGRAQVIHVKEIPRPNQPLSGFLVPNGLEPGSAPSNGFKGSTYK